MKLMNFKAQFLKEVTLFLLITGIFMGYTNNIAFAQVLAPVISKDFIPDFVDDCGCSQLVITIFNPATTHAVLQVPFEDQFPRDLRTVGFARTTCPGGVVRTDTSSVVLESATFIAGQSCTIIVDVESRCNNRFVNTIPAGALRTSNGSNLAPASASVEFCCHHESEVRDVCLVENTVDL